MENIIIKNHEECMRDKPWDCTATCQTGKVPKLDAAKQRTMVKRSASLWNII